MKGEALIIPDMDEPDESYAELLTQLKKSLRHGNELLIKEVEKITPLKTYSGKKRKKRQPKTFGKNKH